MRGYGGLEQPDLASRLGVSVTTLSRMENGRSGIGDDVLEAAARACDVPVAFAQSGFARLTRPVSDVERRLYDVEDAVRRLQEETGAAAKDDDDASVSELPADERAARAVERPAPRTPAPAPAGRTARRGDQAGNRGH
jgi:transcriptional regulator with XRE-family HTH domain